MEIIQAAFDNLLEKGQARLDDKDDAGYSKHDLFNDLLGLLVSDYQNTKWEVGASAIFEDIVTNRLP
jgi:hypothetical protein